MHTYWKFGAVVAVIIGVLAWLAMGGVTESKTYYKEIKEVTQMGDRAQGQRLRVNGYVEQGSIVRDGSRVSFILHQTPGVLHQDPVRLAELASRSDVEAKPCLRGDFTLDEPPPLWSDPRGGPRDALLAAEPAAFL